MDSNDGALKIPFRGFRSRVRTKGWQLSELRLASLHLEAWQPVAVKLSAFSDTETEGEHLRDVEMRRFCGIFQVCNGRIRSMQA